MLVDVRTYRVRPGKLPQQLDLYIKHGLGPQTRHLGPPVAYLQSESGDLNTLLHLWAFENAADRAQKRATPSVALPRASNSDTTMLTHPHKMVDRMMSGSTTTRLQRKAMSFYCKRPRALRLPGTRSR